MTHPLQDLSPLFTVQDVQAHRSVALSERSLLLYQHQLSSSMDGTTYLKRSLLFLSVLISYTFHLIHAALSTEQSTCPRGAPCLNTRHFLQTHFITSYSEKVTEKLSRIQVSHLRDLQKEARLFWRSFPRKNEVFFYAGLF